jgi:hypothetical protein
VVQLRLPHYGGLQVTNIESERNGLIGFSSGQLDLPAKLLYSEPG